MNYSALFDHLEHLKFDIHKLLILKS